MLALGVARRDRGLIEKAEAHRPADLGMMAGRSRRDEGVVGVACDHRIGRRDRAADAAHDRFPCSRRHRGVAIEIDQTVGRRNMPVFGDILLVVAERDRIQLSFRRLAARQLLETTLGQHLIDSANPIRSLGVTGWRCMIEAGGMRENKRCHAKS
jgi:hypothetical protein